MEERNTMVERSGVRVFFPKDIIPSDEEIDGVISSVWLVEEATRRRVHSVYFDEDREVPGVVYSVKFVFRRNQ